MKRYASNGCIWSGSRRGALERDTGFCRCSAKGGLWMFCATEMVHILVSLKKGEKKYE